LNSSDYRQVSERAATWVSANLAQFEYHSDHDLIMTAQLKALSELAIASEILLQNCREDAWFEKKSKEWFAFCGHRSTREIFCDKPLIGDRISCCLRLCIFHFGETE
jgi:hypothetical protein